MSKKTYLLLSTIFFGVAIIMYVMYFISKETMFFVTAIVLICLGCLFKFLYKVR